jgi:3-hydroxyisobutyryl-CoA hydrolase
LSNDNYRDYPHARFGIPREENIESVVRKGDLTPKQVVKHFVQQRQGKQGVKEVVQEVVNRKTTKDDNGKAVWISEDAAPIV